MGHPYGSQGHYHDNQVGRLAQPLKQGSTSPAKCVTAHATTVTLTLAIMNRDGALPYLPSCRTRHIRAELQGRVHRLCIICLHRHSMPMFPSFFKPSFLPFHQLVGFYLCFEFLLQGLNELLSKLLILEVALVHIVEAFPTHPVNTSRMSAVVVQHMLVSFFDPFPLAQQMVQIFKVMCFVRFCFSG